MPRVPAIARVGLLLGAAVSTGASWANAAPRAGQARVPAAVNARAARGESVRVIVGVHEAATPEGRLSATQVAAQRARIRARVDTLLARVPPSAAARVRRFRTIPFFAAEVTPATLAQLQSDPDVATIEEDVIERPVLAESGPLVGAPAAWNDGYAGSGWTVAILDTGVDKAHVFLAGKVIAEACYSDAAGGGGGTALCPGGATESISTDSALDCTGYVGCDHGTHVAGIAAGRGSTFSGIARDASILAIQVFTAFPTGSDICLGGAGCVASYASDQILGLERVLAVGPALSVAAVNLSLGGSAIYSDQAQCDADNASRKAAIDNLRSVGIATVIAAGNSGSGVGLNAPACISSAISVGSTSKADAFSSFSNAAPFLSLLAPGESITSSVPGNVFAAMSGTSMAAPHVTGAWAVLKSRKPGGSVSDLLAALQRTGVAIVCPLDGLTFPRIRVDLALAALTDSHLSIDTPVRGAIVRPSFVIAGWAADLFAESGTGIDAIHVYAYPASGAPVFLGVAAYGGSRPDVGSAFGARFAASGFWMTSSGLAPGSYQIVAFGHNASTNTFDVSSVTPVVVQAAVSSPLATIDTPMENAIVTSPFAVAGWSLDFAATGGSGIDEIDVYATPDGGSPVFVGAGSAAISRPDVAKAFGAQFANAGFWARAWLAPGSYTIAVYSRSTISGTFSSVSRHLVVRSAPLMTIDTPADASQVQGSVLLAGWAIDLGGAPNSGVDAVHVWAYPASGGPPRFLGAAPYGARRDDVGAAFGTAFVNSGYNLVLSGLDPGSYTVVVYARSTVTGTFNQSQQITLTIQ